MRHNDRRSGSCYRNADTMTGAACRVLTFTPRLSCPTKLILWCCHMVCFYNPPWAMANKHHSPLLNGTSGEAAWISIQSLPMLYRDAEYMWGSPSGLMPSAPPSLTFV